MDPIIANFPLVWRWTRATHAVFSEAELAALEPFSFEEAARIHDELRVFDRNDDLDETQFESVRRHSADVTAAEGCEWLRAQAGRLSEKIIVSWDRETALRTTWEIFTARWDDFCYPATDDVLVVPASTEWILRYHHEEVFNFGVRRSDEWKDEATAKIIGTVLKDYANSMRKLAWNSPGNEVGANSDAVIREIERAFKDVKLGDGVSLREADVIDDYGSDVERKRARIKDELVDWRRIPDDAIASHSASLSFFDAPGLRFHLPAYMRFVLRHFRNSDSASIHGLIYHLGIRDERFKVLNERERSAIRLFLAFLTENGSGCVDTGDARRALVEIWK